MLQNERATNVNQRRNSNVMMGGSRSRLSLRLRLLLRLRPRPLPFLVKVYFRNRFTVQ